MTLIRLLFILTGIITTNAQAAFVERITEGLHVFHVVKISPKEYTASLVKSNEGKLGRETVSSMGKRRNADIAVNAGFFELGGAVDGKPSYTLVINGHKYKVDDNKQDLLIIERGTIRFLQANPAQLELGNQSMITGMPMLLINGEILTDIYERSSPFYTDLHARSSVGVTKDGTIILLIAEHFYAKDVTEMKWGEISSWINTNAERIKLKYSLKNVHDATLLQLRYFMKDEFSAQDKTQGITVLKLAELMKSLGCINAINLDGGGSTTLWVNGKVINQTFGDEDEAQGIKIERPVSDALIFKKR